jgi:hypothetical protein
MRVLGCFRFEAKTQGSICCWLDLVANGSVFGLHRKIVASGPMRTKRELLPARFGREETQRWTLHFAEL